MNGCEFPTQKSTLARITHFLIAADWAAGSYSSKESLTAQRNARATVWTNSPRKRKSTTWGLGHVELREAGSETGLTQSPTALQRL